MTFLLLCNLKVFSKTYCNSFITCLEMDKKVSEITSCNVMRAVSIHNAKVRVA